MSYHIGSCREDSKDYRGWLIGSFAKPGPRHNSEVEVKYWELDQGPSAHPMKTSSTIECTIILSGKARAVIDGSTHILSTGQYVVIHPGIPNNLIEELLEPTIGITIKAPSDPSAKKVIRERADD